MEFPTRYWCDQCLRYRTPIFAIVRDYQATGIWHGQQHVEVRCARGHQLPATVTT